MCQFDEKNFKSVNKISGIDSSIDRLVVYITSDHFSKRNKEDKLFIKDILTYLVNTKIKEEKK